MERAFGGDVDYAIVSKRYRQEYGGTTRYSPAKLKSAIKEVIRGNPDPRHISTSYIERQNLTMRMSMRRFTRLTNAFSKKAQNHAHAVALHFMYLQLRPHSSDVARDSGDAGRNGRARMDRGRKSYVF